jgi:hypothetical protein
MGPPADILETLPLLKLELAVGKADEFVKRLAFG